MENFLLILSPGLRFDVFPGHQDKGRLDQLGLTNGISTSNLSEMVDRGCLASNVRTTHTSTPSSLASLLTGLYPREHHLWHEYRSLDRNIKTLADYFDEAGYYNLIMNGHETYSVNGLGNRFHEFSQGPLKRFLKEVREMNQDDVPVFGIFQTDLLRPPYSLTKFPEEAEVHDFAVDRANELVDQLGQNDSYNRDDAHRNTKHERVEIGANYQLPLWEFYLEEIYTHDYLLDLDNPGEFLAGFYLEGVEIFDKHIVGQLLEFVGDHGDTSLLISSDRGETLDVSTERELDEVLKPEEDVARTPSCFVNVSFSEDDLQEDSYRSTIDIFPTIMDEFDLDYNPEEISGVPLTEERKHEIFMEGADYLKIVTEDDQIFPRFGGLTWSAVLSQDGYKFYRRGEPVLESDLDRPLDKFLRVIFAKIHCVIADRNYLEDKMEELSDADSPEVRENLIRQLEHQARTAEETPAQRQLFNVQDDFFEQKNLLEQQDGEEIKSITERLETILSNRFPSPHDLETEESEENMPFKTIQIEYDMQESVLDDLGYVE